MDADHGELPQLQQWRDEADEKSAAYRHKQAQLRAAAREKELRELHALKDYVNERSKVFRRRHKQMELLAQQEERDRVERRLGDREQRRQAKFAQYLEAERAHMAAEDSRAYGVRLLAWETAQIEREREDMFNAQLEQTEVDRFWGLDLFERSLGAEEQRLKAAYERKVVALNQQMASMHAALPSFGSGKKIRQRISWTEHSGDVKHPGDRETGERQYLDAVRAREKERARRDALIKKLKAEEVRTQLRYRLSGSYA